MSKTIRVKTAELQLILEDLTSLYNTSHRIIHEKKESANAIGREISKQREFVHACEKLITDIKQKLKEVEDE